MDLVFVDVDVQFDFCDERGALRVPDAPNDVFRRLTEFAVSGRIPVVGSVDSHAWDAWEFASSSARGPAGERPGFPDHCVKGTAGWLKPPATLPPRFRFVPDVPALDLEAWVMELCEGTTQAVYFEKEVYSLFANPLAERFLARLTEELRARAGGSTGPELVVYGVATDYCVKAAALGLRDRGYRCALLTDAVAGITPGGVEAAMAEMKRAGVRMARAAELLG
jgi:nicotinamidase/pyrazinamidase